MKGFPNQVADLAKISLAVSVLNDLLNKGQDPCDDGVFGEALVHAGVAGTGHGKRPIVEYLAEMKTKAPSYQSHRTTARGLRELFRVLKLINRDGEITLTSSGKEVVEIAGLPFDKSSQSIWRFIVSNMSHRGGDPDESHPYQVLLNLVAKVPGISRAKCALCLEAKDDSLEELERIVLLANKYENDIISEIGTTKTGWDNAKKVILHFAEQLGDVVQRGNSFHLSDTYGKETAKSTVTNISGSKKIIDIGKEKKKLSLPRASRSSSKVTADTIAIAGTGETSDEFSTDIVLNTNPEDLKQKLLKLKDRLKRHNLIVQRLAAELEKEGADLYEFPFDLLGLFDDVALLVEVKSLDDNGADEVDRVRGSLAQLLYYESFAMSDALDCQIKKIACFEKKIQDKHIKWLANAGIATIWINEGGFSGNEETKSILKGHLGF